MINPEKLIKNGKISYIGKLSPEDVKYIHHLYGLSIPEDVLASYFKSIKDRKSVNTFEIFLLERIYLNSKKVCVSSFKTNDTDAGKIFDDLYRKHVAVNGEDAPLSLEALSTVTGKFIDEYLNAPEGELKQSFKKTKLERFVNADLNVASLPVFSCNGETLGLYRRIERGVHISDNSCLISLLPAYEMTDEKYGEIATSIMAIAENSGVITHPAIIEDGGVIERLVNLGSGAHIDIASYPQNTNCCSFIEEMEKFAGKCSFLVREDRKKMLLPLILGSGVVAVECAKLCDGDEISVSYKKNGLAKISIPYIKSIKNIKPIDIISSPEYSDVNINVKSIPLCECADVETRRTDIFSVYTTLLNAATAAESEIDTYTMQNSTLAMLLTVFKLAGKGVNRRSTRMSYKISTRPDAPPSYTVDTLLAIHKVQTELAIRSEGNEEDYNADKDQLLILANGISASTENMPSDKLQGDGKLYVLSCCDTKSINYDTVRKVLDYISSLVASGKIKSSRVFINTPLDDAIASVKADGISCDIRDTEKLLCPKMYVLMESDEEIKGTYLGQTTAFDTDGDPVILTEN